MSKNPNIALIGGDFLVKPSHTTILEDTSYGLGSKKLKFKVILQEKDVINSNRRSYSEEVLREIVRQLSPKATERKLVAELDHPVHQTPELEEKLKRTATVSLKEACILFTKIEFDGKFIIAECETLTTPNGLLIYSLIKDKVIFGFSLRALGSSRKRPDGTIEVLVQDLKAITFDAVSNPSHTNALITEFLNESEIGNAVEALKRIREDKNEINLNSNYIQALTSKYPNVLQESYFLQDGPKYIEQGISDTARQIILESEEFSGPGVNKEIEKYGIGNTIVSGTIDESISYFLNMKDNNKIIGFRF